MLVRFISRSIDIIVKASKISAHHRLTHLDLFVFLCEFSTQFLQLVFHRNGLVQFRLALILILLQLIGPLFAFGIVAIQFLHVRQKFGVFFMNGLESSHRGFDIAEQLVQISCSLLDLTLYRTTPVGSVGPPHTHTQQTKTNAKCRASHAPISASWSFSPAASCSSCEILAASNFDVSLGSATFFPLFFFDIAADDILQKALSHTMTGIGTAWNSVDGDRVGNPQKPKNAQTREAGFAGHRANLGSSRATVRRHR